MYSLSSKTVPLYIAILIDLKLHFVTGSNEINQLTVYIHTFIAALQRNHSVLWCAQLDIKSGIPNMLIHDG